MHTKSIYEGLLSALGAKLFQRVHQNVQFGQIHKRDGVSDYLAGDEVSARAVYVTFNFMGNCARRKFYSH